MDGRGGPQQQGVAPRSEQLGGRTTLSERGGGRDPSAPPASWLVLMSPAPSSASSSVIPTNAAICRVTWHMPHPSPRAAS